MRFEYAIEMTAIVTAVIATRTIASERWVPRARNASSGPYAEDESPSAPRPTHARNATRDTRWKMWGSLTSRGLPRRTWEILLGSGIAGRLAPTESLGTETPRDGDL